MSFPQFSSIEVTAQRTHFESLHDSQTLDSDGLRQYLEEFFTARKNTAAFVHTHSTPTGLATATATQCFEDLKLNSNQKRISFNSFMQWIVDSDEI